VALWALPPDPDTERRFRTVNSWDRIRRETAWGRPKSVAESADAFPAAQLSSSDTSLVGSISTDLEIPTFVRLPRTGGEMRQAADQSPLAPNGGYPND
jgi:hypothetical protein